MWNIGVVVRHRRISSNTMLSLNMNLCIGWLIAKDLCAMSAFLNAFFVSYVFGKGADF